MRYFVILVLAFASAACGSNSGLQVDREDAQRVHLFDLKARCAEIGRRHWQAEWAEGLTGDLPAAPQFNYDRTLNTCVMLAGRLNFSMKSEERVIVDLLTNVELAKYARFDGHSAGLSSVEFDQRVAQFWPVPK